MRIQWEGARPSPAWRHRTAVIVRSSESGPRRTCSCSPSQIEVALRARCVPGATPHRGRGDQALPARSRFRGSRPLDPTALDGRRPGVAVPAGKSLRAGGSVQRASSPRPDGSDRTRASRGALAAPRASIPGAGCLCRTSSLRAAAVRPA